MEPISEYFDYRDREDRISGGEQMVTITTPSGTHRVWTRRVGNNPGLKVLLLHGGPAAPHQYLLACDGFLPAAGVEYYYYDQLGCGFSDIPDDPALWEMSFGQLPRSVDHLPQRAGVEGRLVAATDSGAAVLGAGQLRESTWYPSLVDHNRL